MKGMKVGWKWEMAGRDKLKVIFHNVLWRKRQLTISYLQWCFLIARLKCKMLILIFEPLNTIYFGYIHDFCEVYEKSFKKIRQKRSIDIYSSYIKFKIIFWDSNSGSNIKTVNIQSYLISKPDFLSHISNVLNFYNIQNAFQKPHLKSIFHLQFHSSYFFHEEK